MKFWNSSISLKRLYSGFTINLFKNFLGVRGKILYFLQVNNLYLLDSEDNKICLSSWVGFEKIEIKGDYFLDIYIYKTGSIIDERIFGLEGQLQSILKGYVVETINSLDFVKYRILVARQEEELALFSDSANYKGLDYIDITKSISWYFDKAPSCGIWGSSGSGKTYLALLILKRISTLTDLVYCCDCKFDEFAYYSKKIGVKYIAKDIESVCYTIQRVSDILDSRYDSDKPKRYKPIFLFIDEFAILKLSISKKEFEKVVDNIRNIVLKGRRARVFIVLIQQYQSTSLGLPIDLLSSLGFRVVLGNSRQLYKNVFEISKDVNLLTKGVGEGYYSKNGGEVKLIFAPKIIDI